MDDKGNNYSKYPSFQNNNWNINSTNDTQNTKTPKYKPQYPQTDKNPANYSQKVNHIGTPADRDESNYQTQYPENNLDTQNQPSMQPPLKQPATNQQNIQSQFEPPIQVATTEEHLLPSQEPYQNETSGKSKPTKRGKIIFMIVILFLLTILFSSAILTYAIAYEKLEISNKPLQRKIAYFVMDYIPFAPATPKYVIEKTALAHETITKSSYNLSLAVNTDKGLFTDFGFDNFDMKATGVVDFTNPNNIQATADISITNEFGIQIMTKDNVLYFQVSKFPTSIFTLLNVDPSGFDPLVNQWIMYDTTTLESEARSFLDEEISSQKQESKEDTYEKLEKAIDNKILENIKVSDEIYNGYDCYKLEFIAIGDLVDYIVEKAAESQSKKDLLNGGVDNNTPEKASDYIEEFKVLAWIEKDSFYARKTVFSTTIATGENSFNLSNPLEFFPNKDDGGTIVTITGAILLDDFGKDVTINIPENPLKIEEAYEILSRAIYGENYLNTFDYSVDSEEAPFSREEPIPNTYPNYTDEYHYEFDNFKDVLGWFDQKYNGKRNNSTQ